MLRARAGAVLVSLVTVGIVVPTAHADDLVGGCADLRFCVETGTSGRPGTGNTKPTPSKDGNGGGGGDHPSSVVDGSACRISPLEPQPAAGSALWEGHSPGDGVVYVNTCGSGLGTGNDEAVGLTFWSKDTPAPAVDPAVLAQRAVDSMLLDRPAIVSPKADGKYTVGVPMWLWVGQSPTTWGPNTASASAGGITVTATAKVSSVAWSMGDGTTVTCASPGTPYTAARGMSPSPDCGHRYRSTSGGQSGARYQGTATSTWTIDWAVTGGGRSGQLTEVRQTPFTVSVGEIQVVGQ